MKLFAFAAVFALLFAFAAAQDCDNPVFPANWQQLSEPQDSTLDICPSGVSLEGKSCCSAATESEIKSFFDQVASAIRQGVELISKFKLPSKPSCRGCTSQQKKLVDRIWSALEKYFERLPGLMGGCFTGLLRYLAGVSCFACSPKWEDYVVAYSNGTYLINLSDSTCEQMQGDCIDWLLATSKFARDIRDALTELEEEGDDPNSGGDDDDDFDFGVGCNTTESCRPYVCYALVGGFGLEANTSVQLPNFGRPARDAATQRMLSGRAASDDADELRAALAAVAVLAQEPHEMIRNMVAHHAAARGVRATAPAGVSNAYTADGYDAYAVGKQSNLNTSANSGAALFGSALAAVLALLAAVLL